MRTAEIFIGNKTIEVQEGSEFKLEGNWNLPVGRVVRFQMKKGIEVEAIVKNKDGFGSNMKVTKIISEDDIAEATVSAENVEFETVPDDAVEEVADEEPIKTEFDTEYKLLVDKKKFTKKEVVSFIESHDLDIDTSKTKANLIKELDALGMVEYK